MDILLRNNFLLSFKITINLFMESSKNHYITIFEKTLNVCGFFKNPSSEPLVKIIYNELVKFGNMFDRCPIKEVCVDPYTNHDSQFYN